MLKQVVVGIVSLVWSASVGAETLTVCQDGTCKYSSIQTAIDFSENGDVVLIKAGTYTITESLEVANKDITIRGEIDGDGNHLTIVIGGPCRHFTLRDSKDFTLKIDSVRLERGQGVGGTYSGDGGSVECVDSYIEFTRCFFFDNGAGTSGNGVGGAIRMNGGRVRLSECVFQSNDAYEGGAIAAFFPDQLHVTNCTFLNNRASFVGGGAVTVAGYIEIQFDQCTFDGNLGYANQGNAVLCRESYPGSVSLRNCTVVNTTDAFLGKVDVVTDFPLAEDLDGGACCVGDACITTTESDCLVVLAGEWGGATSVCVDQTCSGTVAECDPDINGDGEVNGVDLAYVLNAWGPCDE